MRRLAQHVAEWSRQHGDEVMLVFDPPVAPDVLDLAGGNLAMVSASRRGRDAADDMIVDLVHDDDQTEVTRVVTSDRGLRSRLPAATDVVGVGWFRDLIGY